MIVVPTSFVPDKSADTLVQHWQGDDYSEHVIAPIDHYQLMVEDFADALLNKRAPRFAPADAVQNMVVVDQLLAQVSVSAQLPASTSSPVCTRQSEA